MARWIDLVGTLTRRVQFGIGRAFIYGNDAGGLDVRNAADSAFASVNVAGVTASGDVEAATVNVTGDSISLNSDYTETGDDYGYDIGRPDSGQAQTFRLNLPANNPTTGQALLVTAIASGVIDTEWGTVAGGNDKVVTDTTSLVFGSSSPVTMFTLPANAVVLRVRLIIDTAFNGTAPQVSIGISGTASKYMAANQNDLKAAAATVFEVTPGLTANGSTEDLIATYAADSSSAGAARIEVDYVIPG